MKKGKSYIRKKGRIENLRYKGDARHLCEQFRIMNPCWWETASMVKARLKRALDKSYE